MKEKKNRDLLEKAKKARSEIAKAFEDLGINRTIVVGNIKEGTARHRIAKHNKNLAKEDKKKFSYAVLKDGSLEIRRRA